MHYLEDQAFIVLSHVFLLVGYWGIVVAMAIESACIPLPSEIIMPLAGFFASPAAPGGPIFSWWLAGLAGAFGCLVGSIVAYAVGAYGGRPLLFKYGKYVLISEAHAHKADAWFARWGDATVFFSRLLPVVRTFISLPAGVARMSFLRFCIYSFVGSVPWCLALAYAGFKLGQHWDLVRTQLQKFDYLVAAIIVALVAWYVYHQWPRRAAVLAASAPRHDPTSPQESAASYAPDATPTTTTRPIRKLDDSRAARTRRGGGH